MVYEVVVPELLAVFDLIYTSVVVLLAFIYFLEKSMAKKIYTFFCQTFFKSLL